MPWPEFRAEFFAEIQDSTLAPSTVALYRNAFNQFEALVGPKRLDEVDLALVQKFYDKMRKKTPEGAAKTNFKNGVAGANRTRRCIVAAMHHAEKKGWRKPIPWTFVRMKADRDEPRPLTVEEIQRLFQVCHDHWFVKCWTQYYAGLRPAEARWLHKSRIDFAENEIRIDDWRDPSTGELLFGVKTEDSRRTIKMAGPLRQVLKAWFDKYPTLEFVFQNPKNGKRIRKGAEFAYMHRLFLKARVEGSQYQLRHSYATHLLEAGEDIRVVQALMGHRHIARTAKYTLVTAKLKERAAQRQAMVEVDSEFLVG